MIEKKNIKSFVKQTLGCECDDKVFELIESQEDVKVDNRYLLANKINIGNRLLIYVIVLNDSELLKNCLSTLFSIGKKERDARGFNRFRLVIVTEEKNLIMRTAEPFFKDLVDRDDKMHLHVIAKTEVYIRE